MLNIWYDIYTDWPHSQISPVFTFHLSSQIMNINRKQENKNGRPGNAANRQADQGIKVASELLQSTYQEREAAI